MAEKITPEIILRDHEYFFEDISLEQQSFLAEQSKIKYQEYVNQSVDFLSSGSDEIETKILNAMSTNYLVQHTNDIQRSGTEGVDLSYMIQFDDGSFISIERKTPQSALPFFHLRYYSNRGGRMADPRPRYSFEVLFDVSGTPNYHFGVHIESEL